MSSALSRSRRLKAAFIAAVGTPVISALGRTYRWTASGTEHLDAVTKAGQQPIFAFWHGRIMPAILYFRGRGIVVITSENFDGEWIARVIGRFGFATARGSSSRGGVRALVQLRRDMKAGRPVAFTVDGPRGPREVAQPGAVWLAGATGNPIIPFHIEASSYWTARSWDRHQVPRPFSRVAIVIGAPLAVPAGADDAAIETARTGLEATLSDLRWHALRLLDPGRRNDLEAPR